MPVLPGGPWRSAVLAVLWAALSLPPTAVAQIQEIVVTARKKEERLQDVPISVAAFGEEQLRQQGLGSDYEIADFTVNFNTLAQTGRDYDRPVIRGMAAPASRGEPNASYFIDGIYVSGSIAAATTSAIQRVEILRGPQSAQFGRATFSGAINYVTKDPTNEFEGQITTRAGTHDTYEVGASLSGPVVEDRLTFLVSANWSRYGGEWNNNVRAASDPPTAGQAYNQPVGDWLVDPPAGADTSSLGGEETTDILAKLVWKPWEGGRFNLKVGYTEADDEMFPSLVAPVGTPLAALPVGHPRRGLADTHGGGVGIYNTLNCQLAPAEFYDWLAAGNTGVDDVFPGEQPWWRSSGGAICGELRPEGWENRVNLAEFRNGVTLGSGGYVTPVEPGLRKHQNRYLLEFAQDAGDWTVTSRFALNTESFRQAFDLDHTEARAVFGLFDFDIDRDRRDWSAELRVATPGDLPIRGEVGAYYYDAHVESAQRSFPGPSGVFTGAIGFAQGAKVDIDNRAAFGSLIWDMTERWELDVEGRYASEERKILGGNQCEAAETFYSFTPRVSLNFKPTPDLRFYVQAANGDKPGEFNTEFFRGDIVEPADSQLPPTTFCHLAQQYTTDVVIEPEEQWTYELGAKTTWLENRLRANLAVFIIEWEKQTIFQTVNFATYNFPDYTNTQTLVTTILRNVGDSRNVGAELETQFQVTDELTLIANYGYTHAKFQKGFDSNLNDLTGNGDVSGKWIPSAPEHNVVLGAVVTKQITSTWDLLLRADYSYESKRYVQPSNFTWIGERTLVNLRAGIQSEHWSVAAYVKNLLDDDTPVAGLSFVNFGYGAILPGAQFDPATGEIIAYQFGRNNDVYPNMASINPARGRDLGLEVQYKFGR